jgi:molybdopterin adenylyltransferase
MATEAMPHQQGGSAESVGDPAMFGVVTVSDRASGGVYQDQSGPAIMQFLAEAVHSECVALA